VRSAGGWRGRSRRIGVLMYRAADDPEVQARVAAFMQGLQQLGWTLGRNVRIDALACAFRCRPDSQRRGRIARRRRKHIATRTQRPARWERK
jgi:hypothetical protein